VERRVGDEGSKVHHSLVCWQSDLKRLNDGG